MTARAGVITVMYVVVAVICLRGSPGSDPDVWWHMAAGRWIVQHHALPHVDVFSRLSPSPHWNAYSWLFDLLVYGLYRGFGLVGIMGFVVVMVLSILAALHRITGRLQADFLKAVLIAVAGILCFEQLYSPRSWLFSIFFFIVQLDMLERARSTGRWKPLLWLLPMYAVWANLHIQFMDGLVVLGATACEPWLARLWPWPEPRQLRAGKLFAILGGCVAATLVNPYGWGIYHSAYKLVTEPGVINQIQELLAMPFRNWQNYMVLAMAVAAAMVIARRKKPDLWQSLLLVMGLVISFRSQRDVWFVVSIAAMILAEGLPAREPALRPLPKLARPLMAVAVFGIAFVAALIMHVDHASLRAKMARKLPVHAVDAALAKKYPGPLFNSYGWGGYLIWRMPMPVSIDGRAAVYGEKRLQRSANSWLGKPDWAGNPNLKTARLVIGPSGVALAQLLKQDPDFRLVYKDKVAAVFVRKKPVGQGFGEGK